MPQDSGNQRHEGFPVLGTYQSRDEEFRKNNGPFELFAMKKIEEFFAWLMVFLAIWILPLAAMILLGEEIPDIGALALLIVPIGVSLLYLRTSFRVVPEYERLVIFRLGRCIGAKGPGIVLLIPLIDRPITVDVRERYFEVPHETCITKDNAQIDVDFLFYWKIEEPVWSQVRVQNLGESLKGLATGLLRAVIGDISLDQALAEREHINQVLKEKIDEVTEHWGVYVSTVEIREIVPPPEIRDAMHRQMAAERDKRATILQAEGERQAAILRAEGESIALKKIYSIAKQIDEKTLNLKYLETLRNLGASPSTKYVFPLEFTDLIKPFVGLAGKAGQTSEGKDKKESP
jgi:regulator of protease activity HflC (stomatin/prohibitin superfamily)